jgi:hypothetical protein
MITVEHPGPGARPGVSACPGVDARGHGLTMTILHSGTCCEAWEACQSEREAEAGLWHSSP